MQKKECLRAGLITALAVLSALICARLLLRNLSLFLQFDPYFAAIFAQILDARLQTPTMLILLQFVVLFLLCRIGMKQKKKIVAIICGVLHWFVTFVAVLLLTKVNDIRFCDVLFSLLDVMAKGGL